MTVREQVQVLLDELGTAIGLAGLGLDEDDYAALAFDQVLVSFEIDADGEHLLLYADLGTPGSDANERALLRAALDANLFGRGTAGAVLAREPLRGGLVLQHRIMVQGLARQSFEALLESFLATAESWRGRLRTAAADGPAAETGPALPLMMMSALAA